MVCAPSIGNWIVCLRTLTALSQTIGVVISIPTTKTEKMQNSLIFTDIQIIPELLA